MFVGADPDRRRCSLHRRGRSVARNRAMVPLLDRPDGPRVRRGGELEMLN
jgi:hypothetical protein